MDNLIEVPDGRRLPADVVVHILKQVDCKTLRELWRTTAGDNLPRFREFIQRVLVEKGCELHSPSVPLHREHTTKRRRPPGDGAGQQNSAVRSLFQGGKKKKTTKK